LVLFLGIALCSAQEEEVTITTYYPSPHGSYSELDVHDDLTFRDPGGGATELETFTDAQGNLHLNATVTDYHIIFDDVNQPICYLLRFTTGVSPTYCANGYVSAGFLDDNKIPVDPNNLPGSGYVVCIRGWE
jgi:hypothetical protein